MDLTDKKVLTDLLSKHHLWAQKRLGQNFLVSKKVLNKIIVAAALAKKDYVIEVGAGVGTLTAELCRQARWVLSVEVDQNMVRILKETCGQYVNLKIIQKNILGLELAKVLGTIRDYRVVANLPYYITQPVLRYFLENQAKPRFMVLMVQKEVAEKICAKPGKMSLLSVSVQFFSDPKLIEVVPAESFFPVPKVDSAIIKLRNIAEKFPKVAQSLFFQIVKAGFSGRRKQLKNSLSAGLRLEPKIIIGILKNVKIEPERRAETLSLEEWHEIYQTFESEFQFSKS